MKIAICGSMSNYQRMVNLKNRLAKLGHFGILPETETEEQKQLIQKRGLETSELKIKYDVIRKHYRNILEADCVLVANYDKKGIRNYIGGNSFLEMGFAFILRKPIYLLKPIPSISFYYHEMKAMQPIVLNDDLTKIGIK